MPIDANYTSLFTKDGSINIKEKYSLHTNKNIQ